MIAWLVIYGSPTRQFYRDPTALPDLAGKYAKHAMLTDPGTLHSSTAGENSTIVVTLDNKSARATALLAMPPHGSPAKLMAYSDGANVELFSGVVDQVDLTATDCRITLIA